MFGATWNVHLRVPPPGGDAAAVAHRLALECGQLLDEEMLEAEPLRLRFAYLRKHEAERLFRALRGGVPGAVVWLEMEKGLGIAE